MLTFPKVLGKSLLITIGAILCDSLVSLGGTLFGFSFIEIVGDLMLVEVAVLFLIAGLIEFSSSVGAAHFRKAILGSKQGYDQAAHVAAGRRALVLVLAGTFMFLVLVAVAVLSGS
jgi:hypothetical protein